MALLNSASKDALAASIVKLLSRRLERSRSDGIGKHIGNAASATQ